MYISDMENKTKQEKISIISKMIQKVHKERAQLFVKGFQVTSLGYAFPNDVEEAYGVKRGTSSFGIAVSDLFSDFRTDAVRMAELDSLMRKECKEFENSTTVESKITHARIYNSYVDEFRELNKPIARFVRLFNKVKKSIKKGG